MECRIEWSSSKVEHGKLSASLEPAPDFAFMLEFDRLVDPISHPRHDGWGGVLLAHGNIVVSDLRLESAQELRAFLDETVREASRLAVDTRVREQQQAAAEAAVEARQEAARAAKAQAAAQVAAERDAQLTAAFRESA